MRSQSSADHGFGYEQETYREKVEGALGLFGNKLEFFTQAKASALLNVASRRIGPAKELNALDIGCGAGLTDALLAGHFGSLHGTDTASDAIETAAAANPDATYVAYDGSTLPYSDNSFDVAFAINVMHHLPAGTALRFAQEMRRVISSDGLAVIFEHNPLNPMTRLVVRRCPFDTDVVLYRLGRLSRLLREAGLQTVESRYILHLPFRPPAADFVGLLLSRIPLGAQYYIAARKQA